jgi:hypothetical protein
MELNVLMEKRTVKCTGGGDCPVVGGTNVNQPLAPRCAAGTCPRKVTRPQPSEDLVGSEIGAIVIAGP